MHTRHIMAGNKQSNSNTLTGLLSHSFALCVSESNGQNLDYFTHSIIWKKIYWVPPNRGHRRVIAQRPRWWCGSPTWLRGALGAEVLKVRVKKKEESGRHSPPHFQSLMWSDETAAGGSASGVQSGRAAGHSPGKPTDRNDFWNRATKMQGNQKT